MKKNEDNTPSPVILNGDPLPWVKTGNHLGNELTISINGDFRCPDTEHNLLKKRAIFFDRVHSLKQDFGYCSPRIVCELMRIYGTSFMGQCYGK